MMNVMAPVAAIHWTTKNNPSTRIQDESATDTPGKISATDVLTTMWLAVATAWTVYFFHGLIDSRSVIVHLEQELGRSVDLSRGAFVGFNELHGAFCGHGFRGDGVNSTFTNYIALVMGGFLAYGSGAVLFMINLSRRARQRSGRFSLAMAIIVVLQVGLMFAFADTISVATYFGD